MNKKTRVHFDDLPKFINCTDITSVSLNYIEGHLALWESCGILELNPDFQRGHVWSEEQQSSFIEFLLQGGASGHEFYFNVFDMDTKPRFVCVDGLQRITACRKFLNNEIKAFGYYYDEIDGAAFINLIRLNFHLNYMEKRSDVLKWYLQLNAGGTVHSNEELKRVQNLLNMELGIPSKSHGGDLLESDYTFLVLPQDAFDAYLQGSVTAFTLKVDGITAFKTRDEAIKVARKRSKNDKDHIVVTYITTEEYVDGAYHRHIALSSFYAAKNGRKAALVEPDECFGVLKCKYCSSQLNCLDSEFAVTENIFICNGFCGDCLQKDTCIEETFNFELPEK